MLKRVFLHNPAMDNHILYKMMTVYSILSINVFRLCVLKTLNVYAWGRKLCFVH